jgi:hypothetical protein
MAPMNEAQERDERRSVVNSDSSRGIEHVNGRDQLNHCQLL